MAKVNLVSGLILLLLFQTVGLGRAANAQDSSAPTSSTEASEAPSTSETPSEVPEESSDQEVREPFFDYFGEKYTLFLGIDRAACGYRIDPTDVHERGGTRFATAVVTGSDWGNGCHGYLDLRFVQADCESNTLYTIQRETEGDRRRRGWERLLTSLSIDDRNPNIETSLDEIEQPPAEVICSLSLASTSEVEEVLEPPSGQ